MVSRRHLLASLGGGTLAAAGQSHFPGLPNIGVKADTGPVRSESGVGALLPWADALWAVTYNSHKQGTGTGLGLYRIDEDLRIHRVHVHNGTHANRMVHKESNQAFIGPYAIATDGSFRFIEQLKDHRLTATMRHLQDPQNRVYMLTMEGLLFELDVASLKATELFDLVKGLKIARRPHFKGGYTGQGRVVVANNGFYEFGENDAGLFEFDGKSWNRISSKPHMECAGREDMGNVVFSTGWDESSTLFHALVRGKWQHFRLPRASQSFLHAWQTEWMRIREVETEHFLMDMHGLFFELQPIAWENRIWGVKPVCQHLRIIPDYAAFRGLLALGGNQTSPNQDNNTVAGQPQSGIWFGKTDDLWSWGKPQGWGGPWRRTSVQAGTVSDPFLMTAFEHKVLHLRSDRSAEFELQVDFQGGEWASYGTLTTGAEGYRFHVFPPGFSAHWVRILAKSACTVSAEFIYT